MARETILTHPSNIALLRKQFAPPHVFLGYPEPPYTVFGIEIIAAPEMPRTAPVGKPIFDKWAFVDFEEKDADWCLYFGFARRAEEPYFLMMREPKLPKAMYGLPYSTGPIV